MMARLAPSAPLPPQTNQIQLALGWAVAKSVADWLKAAVAHTPVRVDGSIVVVDSSLQMKAAYDWTGGSVSQVLWPACDAGLNAPASPVVTIQTVTLTPRPSVSGPLAGNWSVQRRGWTQNDFGLTSNANIGASLQKILRVSALSLSPGISGGSVEMTFAFGLERPDLMAPFMGAMQAGGQIVPGQSTDITLHNLTPNLAAEMSAVTLLNCRVTRISTGPAAPGVRPMSVVALSFADASVSIASV